MSHQACFGPDIGSELEVSNSISGVIWITWRFYSEKQVSSLELQLTKEQAKELLEHLQAYLQDEVTL